MIKKDDSADILIINDNNLSFLGGERESQLIIINAVKNDYRVAVIQPGAFNEKLDNVDVIWLTKKRRMKELIKNPFAFVSYILKVGEAIKRLNPRIIHTNSQVSFFIVALLLRLKIIKHSFSFIHTDRGLYTKYSHFFRGLFQLSFKYLDTLVTTTEFNRNCWSDANSKKRFKMEYLVIENTAGFAYESFDAERTSRRTSQCIGFAGRMCDWKGWPLAESICSSLELKDKSFRYVMYVSCLDSKSKEETLKMFERMETKFGERFQGRINVPFIEMEQFYYDIDFYILTSLPKSESFGRTIVEAMSRNTVVLTTDAGGSVEVVNDRSTVHSTPEEFANHIVFLKNNPHLMNEVKKRNFDRVRKVYSLKNNTEKYRLLYGKTLNGGERQ